MDRALAGCAAGRLLWLVSALLRHAGSPGLLRACGLLSGSGLLHAGFL
jgi:hypothetical protein